MGETSKARERRLRTGWFERFAPPHRTGLDLGCQTDPINATFRRWDLAYGDGDATYLDGVPDNSFWTVYASHVLEHLDDTITAIRNWYRVTRPGGHVVICVPHRDLYERQTTLPSRWNSAHRSLWLPFHGEPPDTHGLRDTVLAAVPDADIVLLETRSDGYDYGLGADAHPTGEYSLEIIAKKW